MKMSHNPSVPYSYREVLERRLQTVEDALADHFDDRICTVDGLRDLYRATPDMSSCVNLLERLPVAIGHVITRPKVAKPARVKRETSLRTIGVELEDRETDRSLLTRDWVIVCLSMFGILLTLIATLMSWYFIYVPNAKQTRDWSSILGCSNISEQNKVTGGRNQTTYDWLVVQMNCTKLQECWEESMKNFNTTNRCKYDSGYIYNIPDGKKGANASQWRQIVDYVPKYETYVRLVTYLVFGTTLAVYAGLGDYYRLKHRQKVREWGRVVMYSQMTVMDSTSNPYSFWRSAELMQFCGEIFIHMLFPYPWLPNNFESPGAAEYLCKTEGSDQCQVSWHRFVHTFLELCMVLRVYVVIRLLHHRSPAYKLRHHIVKSNPDMVRTNYQVTIGDSMKLYFYNHTVKTLLTAHLVVTFTGGFAIFLLERDNRNQLGKLDEFINCLFTMFVTIRTIGYGDMKAVTPSGRLATVLFSICGIAVEMLLGSLIINKFSMSKDETIVNEFLKSNTSWCEYQVCSAMLIQAAWKASIRYKYLRGLVSKAVHDEYRRHVRVRKNAKRKEVQVDPFNLLKGHHTKYTTFVTHASEHGYVPPTLASDSSVVPPKPLATKTKQATVLKESNDFRHEVDARQRAYASGTQESTLPPIKKIDHGKKNLRPDEMVSIYKQIFTTDIDVAKFRRMAVEPPPGFRWERTLSATRVVTSKAADGKLRKRRVPRTDGHKSNILLEALKHFRAQRRSFKECLTASSDHKLEEKLQEAFTTLEKVVKGLHSAELCMANLRHTTNIELDSLKQYLRVEIGAVKYEPRKMDKNPLFR